VDEFQVEPVFQRGDAPADIRFRHIEDISGRSEAVLFHDGCKNRHIREQIRIHIIPSMQQSVFTFYIVSLKNTIMLQKIRDLP